VLLLIFFHSFPDCSCSSGPVHRTEGGRVVWHICRCLYMSHVCSEVRARRRKKLSCLTRRCLVFWQAYRGSYCSCSYCLPVVLGKSSSCYRTFLCGLVWSLFCRKYPFFSNTEKWFMQSVGKGFC